MGGAFLLRKGGPRPGVARPRPPFFFALESEVRSFIYALWYGPFPAPGRVAVPCRGLLLDAGLFLPLAIRFLILCYLLVLISFCGFTRSSSVQ